MNNILLGVGNSTRADDGIGPYIANNFKDKDWKCIDTQTVPENFTGVIRKDSPKLVIIIDSAEMDLPAGEFRIIPKEKLGKLKLTTHAMPLSILIEYLEEFVEKVIFIGVQPKTLGTCNQISPELKKSAKKLVEILKDKNIKLENCPTKIIKHIENNYVLTYFGD